ncbi:MAG: sulfotransferase [Planctomycetota bacterium]|nr:sulfotransferase [Planctomycetota bacterium]MDA0920614.1 sulfotransferase [Planctomycetota bacterium]MDA1160156.1 sulfotransferase [Planctomycetota bacterium]
MRSLRNSLRNQFFKVWSKACATDDSKQAVAGSLRNLLAWRPGDVNAEVLAESPYAEIGRVRNERPTCERSDIILVSARFRSGSTLLWNLFRNIPGFVSYYEPFNERRWFDPDVRGARVDSTHRKVADYWTEYDGMADLGAVFDEAWNEKELYMSEGAWNPRMKSYMEQLVERANGRPVLQFNRLDFRLPWARQTFPNAKLVHLYRHPRDQWASNLQKIERFSPDGKMSDFATVDGFYLLNWARDLKYHFPFLDEQSIEHPYQLHYFLWKLSYVYGRSWSDVSLGFEELTTNPERALFQLFEVCGIDESHVESLLPLIEPPPFGKWKNYADDAWFKRHEESCEEVLASFFATRTPEVRDTAKDRQIDKLSGCVR